MKIAVVIVSVEVLLIVGIYGGWVALYPEEYDPKNMHYVMWKHGLSRHINLDDAVGGMTHDTWAVYIVKGMSKEQLNQRFGYIRTLDESQTVSTSLLHTARYRGRAWHFTAWERGRVLERQRVDGNSGWREGC